MIEVDLFNTPMEFKAVGDGNSGEFEAYGAVFGNKDWHGDVIAPGAAVKGLAERTADGRKVAMHLDHGLLQFGGIRNIGVWKHIGEDSKGVLGHGKLFGMNTDIGRLRLEQMRDGGLPGMSITYEVRQGGAVMGRKSSEPKRLLTDINITEMGPVTDPSNTEATVTQFKTLMQHADVDTATKACAAALMLHRASMSGGDAPTKDERAQLFQHLGDIHEALTGDRMPKGMKAARTESDFVEIFLEMGIPAERAGQLAADAFKSAISPPGETKSAIKEIGQALSGFRMPAFG